MIAIMKNNLALSIKIVHTNNSSLELYPKEIFLYVNQEIGSRMFTETLLVGAKK